MTTGFKTTYGVFIFSDHGGQMPFGKGSKVNTPSADCRRFSNWSKSKPKIPTTTNVPEPLVFSGFPDILFIPFWISPPSITWEKWVFLIFCSFPLYQLSGLHFRKFHLPPSIKFTVAVDKIIKQIPLVPNT